MVEDPSSGTALIDDVRSWGASTIWWVQLNLIVLGLAGLGFVCVRRRLPGVGTFLIGGTPLRTVEAAVAWAQ